MARAALESCDALRALLARRGDEVPRQVLLEALEHDRSGTAICELLREQGRPARVVRVSPRELHHLPCPTLLLLDGDRAAVLVRVRHRGAVLAGLDGGEIVVPFAELALSWSGNAIELTPPGSSARTVRGFLRDGWTGLAGPIGFIGAVSVALLLVTLAVPFGTEMVIDWALPDGAPGLLTVVAASLFVLGLFQALLGYVRETALAYLECRLTEKMQRGLLERILALPFALVQGRRIGEQVQLMASTQTAGQSITQLFLVPAIDGTLGIAYLVVLAWWTPLGGAIAAGLVVLSGLLVLRVGRKQAALQREELAAQGLQNDRLLELVNGVATIKACADPDQALSGWLSRLTRERIPGLERQRAGLAWEAALDSARHLCLIGVLLAGGKAALEGTLTVGALLAAVQITQALWESMSKLADGWLRLALVIPHLELIEPTLASPSVTPAKKSVARFPRGVDVVIDAVRYRHGPMSPWVLLDYSLRVEPGQHLVLRGLSGSGKTTILRLLAGLYEPQQGSVAVGGLTPATAKHLVAYLPQDAVLLQGTILDNLRILSGRATRDRLLAAASATGLDDFVRTLPMGYDTVLPPGASTLSGGQRQLISLSACIASDRPVLLLDEAMSHLDAVTQRRIHSSNVFKGRTVISVVHDERTGEKQGESARVPSRIASSQSANLSVS